MSSQSFEKAQFLCSRLCHDLLGPVGALGMGLELLSGGEGAEEVLGLIQSNGDTLKTKLEFFRTAFGWKSSQIWSFEMLVALTQAYYLPTKASFSHPQEKGEFSVPSSWGQLFLQLSLIPLDCLPRGGKVSLQISAQKLEEGFSFEIEGEGSTVPSFLQEVYEKKNPVPLTPRNILYFLAWDMANQLGARLHFQKEGGTRLSLQVSPEK